MDEELKIQERKAATPADEAMKSELCFAPPVDIYETENEVMVLADMPGVTTEGVDLSLEDNILTIIGHHDPVHFSSGRALLEEYETGHYLRRFTVSKAIDLEQIEASLADGVLKVRLPKSRPAQPKKIAVRIG